MANIIVTVMNKLKLHTPSKPDSVGLCGLWIAERVGPVIAVKVSKHVWADASVKNYNGFVFIEFAQPQDIRAQVHAMQRRFVTFIIETSLMRKVAVAC